MSHQYSSWTSTWPRSTRFSSTRPLYASSLFALSRMHLPDMFPYPGRTIGPAQTASIGLLLMILCRYRYRDNLNLERSRVRVLVIATVLLPLLVRSWPRTIPICNWSWPTSCSCAAGVLGETGKSVFGAAPRLLSEFRGRHCWHLLGDSYACAACIECA